MPIGRIEIPRMAGQYARARREELGLTKHELALRSGVSEKTIYSFERGDKPNMHLAKLLAVYDALGLALEVGTAQPRDIREPVAPTTDQLVSDFLAHMGGTHGGG